MWTYRVFQLGPKLTPDQEYMDHLIECLDSETKDLANGNYIHADQQYNLQFKASEFEDFAAGVAAIETESCLTLDQIVSQSGVTITINE
jgi:hypothetical protein